MSEQMRLCPCGLPAQSYTTESANGIIRYVVGCNDWTCQWSAGEFATEAEAVTAWNQRAGEAELDRLRDLERAVRAVWAEGNATICHLYGRYVDPEAGDAIDRLLTQETATIGRLLEGEE